MIELAQHIEILLLENDCVIIPGLGGFVGHYNSATRVAGENLFLPPTRVIGFNPQLKMNDGLLVQSYMAVYGTSFSDATKIVEKEVDRLFVKLHEDGKLDLPNIGELRYSSHDTYDFFPYDNKITTPYLYGLDNFEMQELSVLSRPVEKLISSPVTKEKKRKSEFRINTSYFSNAVAAVAIITLFFFLSTPIENTEVIQGNYAQMLPSELFEKIEKQSLVINPIIVHQSLETRKTDLPAKNNESRKKVVAPIIAREVKVSQVNATSAAPNAQLKHMEEADYSKVASENKVVSSSATLSKFYHIIVASVGTEKDAENIAKQLIEKGFSNAKAIIGDGKMRVSIESCDTEAEAYRILNEMRQNNTYQNAWVLKK